MKYLKSFFLSIMLLVIISSPYDVNAEYSRNDSNVASTVISDYMSRYGEDLFQWDQNAWYELGNELGSVKGIYQTKDEVVWGFACQVYAYPEHSKCTPAERAAAIEYARCLLQKYENITPLKSTAVFILDSLDEDAEGAWIVSFQTADGFFTYEITQERAFRALHHYDETDLLCMPFINGNTFLRRTTFPLFWRTQCAPESFWEMIEPYCMTCYDMTEMLAIWCEKYDYDKQPSLNRAIDYLWTSRLHPGDSYPLLYGIPDANDLSMDAIIDIVRQTCIELGVPYNDACGMWVALQYNRAEFGGKSWSITLFSSADCVDVTAWFEFDAKGELLSWSIGPGNG